MLLFAHFRRNLWPVIFFNDPVYSFLVPLSGENAFLWPFFIVNFDLPPPFPFRYYISEAGGTKKTNYFACGTKISKIYAFLRPYFDC